MCENWKITKLYWTLVLHGRKGSIIYTYLWLIYLKKKNTLCDWQRFACLTLTSEELFKISVYECIGKPLMHAFIVVCIMCY